ncbi:flgK [Wigglesworthia glossinidia endosymbiont of Glossina brevipalpis]|uniref:Flagellar hook-associated protein 1 n=1 Tax=Wigglesworthia glossinidia brevipalpis TaxID=36870 RepID=Q8D3F5_WIGBR|nr:flgK [Wigglesworthia glossinidia endosymbiont of Glossina brevipalpis]
MFNLYRLAGNALKAGEIALDTIGKNIANSTSSSYHKEKAILSASEGKLISEGYIGNGAHYNRLTRIQDELMSEKMRYANSSFYYAFEKNKKIKFLDYFFSENNKFLEGEINNVFDDLEFISQEPFNEIYKESAFLNFKSLNNHFNFIGKEIKDLENNIYNEIKLNISDINSLTSQLSSINKEILKSKNEKISLDLLDKRDQLLSEISKKIGISVNFNEKSTVNVALENGFFLVDKDQSNDLKIKKYFENDFSLFYENSKKEFIQIDSDSIQNGEIGGLISFYNKEIPIIKEKINFIIFSLAKRFNEVNKSGYDSNKSIGQDIFSYSSFKNKLGLENKGNLEIHDINTKDNNHPAIYELFFQSNKWFITKKSEGKTTEIPYQSLDENSINKIIFDKINLHINGSPEDGDRIQIRHLLDVSEDIKLNLISGKEIAHSSKNENTNNNENSLKLANIQNEKIINNETFTENYAKFISYVGETANNIQSIENNQKIIFDNIVSNYENKIGVNLDEEYVQIEFYRQYYHANAQIIKVASTLFDSLLNVVRK